MLGVGIHVCQGRTCTTHTAAGAAAPPISLRREGSRTRVNEQPEASHPGVKGYLVGRCTMSRAVTKSRYLTRRDEQASTASFTDSTKNVLECRDISKLILKITFGK